MNIRKAVIPVAGKGTRFLPATKQTPKEMLPIINIPMVHYCVMEAVESGIEQLIFVTSSGKGSIENYFDRNLELENFLEQNGKLKELELIQNVSSMIEIITVRQKEQLGLGHAINCASPIVGSETFSVILGDDIVRGQTPATKQLIDVSRDNGGKSVIGVMEVPETETYKYGIVDGEFLKDSSTTLKMNAMIEKPKPAEAPTNLATPGRYILSGDIFECLREIPRGVGGEYQLTDAINMLANKDEVYAHKFIGDRFDTGCIEGYLNATVEFALRDESTKDLMLNIIKEKIKTYGIK
ncbi:UTP--glucose-1-phosphate uridylyltransferase [Halobacteriovorax marinus]|uniref:UTP--glucose-1-phosphate uridylyltransferase n=1 Tax=Halobacteriovorax marinus (strain ATCC BAA-682 / DSM 15412 / SJ) TaxID=862908 RepID=E1X185_HALMS|nr:UTP--glucose-1-phosphate uridylyltransferase GalU [Halobacteriovorax marinus]ATH09415.1 UTP--glucose-1-phosphate uridylyltransferase [Halobacteriovorax marinus]CBW28155.1 UTP--glucose-1-phosphate uridylyltransferase [Halobacteriovorax marinus SJ]